MKTIFVAGLSYKSAPVEVRERLAVAPSQLQSVARRLKIKADLSEIVLLSTCNRVEIYGVVDNKAPNAASLFDWFGGDDFELSQYLFLHEGADAAQHLLSVASGLDSMVLGETEITGQVKNAYQVACTGKLTGGTLNRVFQKALQTAKTIRTQTLVGRGATSVGSAAVELAEKIFGPGLAQQNIMIMGAGKMGEACVRHLAKRGAKTVLISNRSIDKAEALAIEIGGRAIRFEESFRAMIEADIVVCSTGCPQTVLHRHEVESVMRQRTRRPLVLIDIAVPRNIAADVQAIENVYLHNIDDLEALVRENVQLRERELERCRAIVDEQTEAVMAKLAGKKGKSEESITGFQPAWNFAGQMVCAA